MATPKEFRQDVEKFRKALIIEMPIINQSVALNAFALVNDRVINQGTDETGSSFGDGYSETPLPAFFYEGKSLNSGGEDAVAKAKKEGDGLSYKDFRSANNLQTGFVDLNFSGQMWRDIGVVRQTNENGIITTVVGAKNTRDRDGKTTDDIMEFNGERFGDFLEVSEEEEQLLAQTYDTKLQELIDEFL